MYRALTCMSLICLFFCVPAAEGKNYAVLISAGVATTDDAAVNSCFWYNPYLQYVTLLDERYDDDDIYFLYGYGTDFNSSHACYQPPYAVTDYPVSRANIQSVFTTLAGIMTSGDFLYVWWMGHGGPSGNNLVMSIDTTGESVWDYEIAAWVGQITDYDVRTFSWMTCYSGGILDDLEGSRSIVMSSATFHESTVDLWLCDTWHAEFHYPERCAWAWETPCGICDLVDADSDDDSRVSFLEAFTYAEANTASSHPQISDLGGLAADTYLGGCTSQGELALDQAEYACSDDAGARVMDCDLNADDEVIESVTVTIDSTTEPGGETVLLTETGPASADFRGTIELNTSDAPGVLHISEGDVVTATYIDADDGQGGVNVVVIDTAVVDCTPPQISNVQTASVEPRSATVTFDTDEPTKGTVRYGFVCGALTESAAEVGFSTDHTVNLSGLEDDTTYFYAVDAEDEAGNSASDDNGGACYALTTPYAPDYFTEEFTGDFDLENHTITFIPDGSSDYYCACGEDTADFPTDPTGGEALSLGDDDYSTITLSGGETVSLYGGSYPTFYVGSNGYITFGSGDQEYWPTLEWHFALPRISALFQDLYPTGSGSDWCPGGGGDCCVPNGTPGCEDVACCETVCAIDTYCCEIDWDDVCADEAFSLCGDLCTGMSRGPDESDHLLGSGLTTRADPTVSWRQLADRAAVTWENVPEIGTSNSNSFQIEMFFDGTIRITWLSMDATFGISGLSEGGGLPPDFFESDLSAYGPCPCDDALSVNPIDGFSSSGVEGGPFTPECMIYTLTNTGDSPLDWAAAGTQTWLDVAPASGTLAPYDFTTVDVCINANANSLPTDVYTDTVTFTNVTSGIAQTRSVELTVKPLDIEPPEPVPDYPCHCRKNRMISFVANNADQPVAFRVELIDSPYCPEDVGMTWWVTEPACINCAGQEDPEAPPCLAESMYRARLDANPQGPFLWPPFSAQDSNVINVADCEIHPVATYEICACVSPGGTCKSPCLTVGTILKPDKQWADCVGFWDGTKWTCPDGVVNMDDVMAAVMFFTNDPNRPPKKFVEVDDEGPNMVLNFGDIMQIANGFKNTAYPFACPSGCPPGAGKASASNGEGAGDVNGDG